MDSLSLLPSIYEKIIIFVLIFSRISTLFATFILFHRDRISSRLIISLSAILSFYVLLADETKPIYNEIFSIHFLMALFFQILIGFISGLILNLVFEVFVALGQIVSAQIGLSMASLIDPRLGNITSLTHFYVITISLIFLLLNGHLFIIKLILDSFSIIPLDHHFIPKGLISDVLTYSSVMFTGSILLSITLVMAILVTNLALAVMTKFAPQFNIFSIGINMTLIIGLVCIYVTFDFFIEKGGSLLVECMNFLSSSIGKLK